MGGLTTTTVMPPCLHVLAEGPVYVFAELRCGIWANAKMPVNTIKTQFMLTKFMRSGFPVLAEPHKAYTVTTGILAETVGASASWR